MPGSLKISRWGKILTGKDNEFLHNDTWFLQHGINEDKNSDGENLNFRHKGGIPLTIKNPVYPLPRRIRVDTPDFIKMADYSTEEFQIPKIDIIGLPYDKRKEELADYRRSITSEITTEGIWNVSPFENTSKTPVINATGPIVNGYRTIVAKDIQSLRVALNIAFPGLKKAAWVLVLDTESYWNLSLGDEILRGQMIHHKNYGDVNVGGIKYLGFELVDDDRTPYYDATTGQRIIYGATPVNGVDFRSATAYVKKKTFVKAFGRLEFFDNARDSSYQADFGSFLQRAYIGPLSENLQDNLTFMGAILRKT